MTTLSTRRPVRWFVMSPAAYSSIRGFWREESGDESTLAKRLDNHYIEAADHTTLAMQLDSLPRERSNFVVLVFDHMDAAAYATVDALPVSAVQGLELRLAGFREDPLAIVTAMNRSALVDEDGFAVHGDGLF